MSPPDRPAAETKPARRRVLPDPERRPELTRWKQVLLAVAGLFVVVGFALRATAGPAQEPTSTPSAARSGGAQPQGLVAGDQGPFGEQPAEPEAEGAAPGAAGWSPFFLKGGFSFFVAFCVGYATRAWLKLAALAAGTFFLGVFALSYLGALDVHWTTIGGWWDAFAGRVASEAADLKTFVTGSLPQAGLAGVGLVAGFKKR